MKTQYICNIFRKMIEKIKVVLLPNFSIFQFQNLNKYDLHITRNNDNYNG